MALFHLKSGQHYHGMPPLSTLPWVGEQRMERFVTFDVNCAYDSAAYNADDVNKLFGLIGDDVEGLGLKICANKT